MLTTKPDFCRPCVGFPWGGGKGFSRVTGDNRIPLLLVGEASGRSEERKGEPFVGQAGQVLERAIRISGLKRSDYSITNLIRCRPPDNELRGAPYEFAALNHCRKYLNDVVAERRPRIILALGEIPLRELSAVPGKQADVRGYVLPSIYEGVSIIGTFHPSRILRGDWKLFPVMKHDLMQAAKFARDGILQPLPTNYSLQPTESEVRDYIALLSSSNAPLCSFDVETVSILGEVEPDDWREKEVFQIQFSSAAGTALVLPWPHEGAKAILETPAMKVGWNNRLSDNLVLKHRYGVRLGGELHDGMEMWAHCQADFVSSKDDKDSKSDKSIPSKLMNLQSAVSFYYPYEPLWKATMRRGMKEEIIDRDQLLADVRYGGARDADFQFRIGSKLIATLHRNGLWNGYYNFKHRLGGEVLDLLSDTGLPIDREAQTELRTHIESEELRLLRELQQMVPTELHGFHPDFGYARDSSRLLYNGVKTPISEIISNGYDPTNPPLITLSNSRGYLVQRMVTVEVTNLIEQDCEICNATGSIPGVKRPKKCPKCKATGKRWIKDGKISRDEMRWGLSLFNPSSSSQVLGYIRHQVEHVGQPWHIPTHIDTGKDSANKAGIEQLIAVTGDPVLKQIERCKKVVKLTDYCSGKWVPKADGRVHAEFRFGSANNQTSATNPPVQTYPKHYVEADEWLKPLMKRIKSTIKAPPGYVMIEIDKVGFHARMQGFLAEDADYYRLASLDCHSFVTGHYVGVEDKDSLLSLDDASLLKRLKQIKSLHEYERNYMVKRISFLNQYGGGAEKAATILHMPVTEVMFVLETIKNLFPKSFREFPAKIEKALERSPRLVSPFGCQRWFWDKDLQQAVAFSVANPAHCQIQTELLRLRERGALEKFGFCNYMHDAGWFCVKEELAEECIAVVRDEFERPSEILINNLGAFTCRSDVKMGRDMDSLEDA